MTKRRGAASRAGSRSAFFWGDNPNELGKYAWFADNADEQTHPVGKKRPNRWGLYDMGGLVWEWCEDVWHNNYEGAPQDGSAWLSSGEAGRRVVRGGSRRDEARRCRCADRGKCEPGLRGSNLGFRVVRVSP